MSPVLINFLLLAVGVILLLWAGDWLVRGAAALARKWGVPALIVGLTIVAFGTSAPELVVSIQAVLRGASELAIGNVIGSNIANVLLVLGLPALILAIPTNVSGVGRNSFVAIVATFLMILMMFISNPLVFWQGAILFLGIIIYLTWMFGLAKSGANDPALVDMAEIDSMSGMPKSMAVIIGFILFGIVGLAGGGHLIVENATQIATAFGVSDAVIGLTIVAIGTSLPELATVIVAAYRGQTDVAIGNVLGSNVFNIFAVLGAAALTGPVYFPENFMVFDIWVMLAAIIALTIFVLRRAPIGRGIGAVFFAGYLLYMGGVARGVLEASPPV